MKTLDEASLGLVPVIVQDVDTKDVLMLGFANDEAVKMTRETSLGTFWSRSRGEIWVKGATSGNYLHVQEIKADCDNDTLLYIVKPDGPTCHRGTRTCF